jgi:hypothetical protein
VAKKTAETFIYITREPTGDDDGSTYPIVNESVSSAYVSVDGSPVKVEVYKLIKIINVTREEIYNEEVV